MLLITDWLLNTVNQNGQSSQSSVDACLKVELYPSSFQSVLVLKKYENQKKTHNTEYLGHQFIKAPLIHRIKKNQASKHEVL